jgi:indolepyruvate ferredoxin oxidoreductase
MEQVIASLDAANHSLALEIARIPEQIKGFGHVKERNLTAARDQWQQLMGQWRQPPGERRAA